MTGPSLEDAIALAASAHAGQLDLGGQPYILHPLRVMGRLWTHEERIVGMLHDVLEDTSMTVGILQALGYTDDTIAALDCLTRRDGEPYDDYVMRCAGNTIARTVKIVDLQDNSDLVRLGRTPTDADRERLAKYIRAHTTLLRIDRKLGSRRVY